MGDQINVSGVNLALQSLAWNGGPTPTRALGLTSVAVNGGGVGGGEGNCPDVDQRGGPRTDGTCDVGSYELNAVPPELIFLALCLLLIMFEPDLGTAVTIGATMAALLFVGGGRRGERPSLSSWLQ